MLTPEAIQATQLLDALPMPALLIRNDCVCYCNPAFQALTGLETPLAGKPLRDIFNAESLLNPAPGEMIEGSFIAAGGKRQRQFFQRIPINGSFPEDPCQLIIAILSDTALKQAQSDFVSVVSHEFRTPLTSIKGFADTLLRYGPQLGEAQQKQFIGIIKEQADRLTRLVENLLTVSRLGIHKIELSFRAVEIRKVLETVAQNLQVKGNQDKKYANRTFQITVPPNFPGVWADPDKLEQVLINLADNAVKYSFPNTPIAFTVSIHAGHDEEVDIAILNQGIGISAEQLPMVFNKFSRLDNPLTRSVEGTGLGLYITQALIAAMQGRITLQSTPNEKTVFTVTLPMATAERQAQHRRQQYSEAPGG